MEILSNNVEKRSKVCNSLEFFGVFKYVTQGCLIVFKDDFCNAVEKCLPMKGSVPEISGEEVAASVLKSMRDYKAAGTVGLICEMLKVANEAGLNEVMKVCLDVIESETILEDWIRSLSVPIILYKG